MLEQAVKAFRGAFANRTDIVGPFQALVAASKSATFAERDAAILALLDARGIDAEHAEITGLMAVASGALVEDGASTLLGLDAILDRMAEGAELLASVDGDFDLDAHAAPPATFAEPVRRWIAGWKNHVRGAMARLARDVEARKRARAHTRFDAAVRALADKLYAHHLRYVMGVLDMLDDEPLHVIDLLADEPTIRRYRAFGVRNGFHLMTLLEGHDPIELRESEVDFVRAQYGWFTWGALEHVDGTYVATHLGSTLWGEPRALDVPCFAGVRTIIRATPTFARSWDTGFVVPIHDALRESLILEHTLVGDDARIVLARMLAALRRS